MFVRVTNNWAIYYLIDYSFLKIFRSRFFVAFSININVVKCQTMKYDISYCTYSVFSFCRLSLPISSFSFLFSKLVSKYLLRMNLSKVFITGNGDLLSSQDLPEFWWLSESSSLNFSKTSLCFWNSSLFCIFNSFKNWDNFCLLLKFPSHKIVSKELEYLIYHTYHFLMIYLDYIHW